MNHTLKSLSILGAPLIVLLASCANNTSATTPTAHRHGDLVHSHVKISVNGATHQHGEDMTTIKVAGKKIVVPVKSASASDIKPLGLKAIGHKHHTHIEPKTGAESVPC